MKLGSVCMCVHLRLFESFGNSNKNLILFQLKRLFKTMFQRVVLELEKAAAAATTTTRALPSTFCER